MSQPSPNIQLGCPQWSHPDWQKHFFTTRLPQNKHLTEYSRFYTSVEGNTTFYALPSAQTVLNWSEQVPDNFRFCFKFPQQITHKQGLAQSENEISQFINLFEPMLENQQIGAFQLQLPPYFSGRQLAELNAFLNQYSQTIPLAVEVRHPDFFNKSDTEKHLNQMLMHYQVDRVMIDTRPVHSQQASTPEIIDAQQKKPKLPVHVLATANQPIVRFIGQTDLAANRHFIKPWLMHFKSWLEQNKQPYLFIHTADNAQVHQLTRLWLEMLTEYLGYRPFNSEYFPAELEQQQKPQAELF